MRPFRLALAPVVVVAAGLAVASPAQAAGDQAVTGLKLSSTAVQDVTSDNAKVGVTLRTANIPSSSGPLLRATPRGTYGGASQRTDVVYVDLTNSSGSDSDRTWTGTLTMPGGSSTTWDLSVELDAPGNPVVTPAQLAATGSPSSITTRTTAPPQAVTGLAVNTFLDGSFPFYSMRARATWDAKSLFKPMATEWQVTTSKGCEQLSVTTFVPGAGASRDPGAGIVTCTFKVRGVNAAGAGPWSSGSAVLF